MEHQNLEKMTSTALMLPKENGEEKVVILTPPGVGKILIREDTVLGNFQGCTACGRGTFTCTTVKNQWSLLCWGRQSDKRHYCLLGVLSMTFVLSLIGTIFFCFTNTINDAILSNMVIRNNSLAYSIWRKPNVQPLMKVYLFNYTNWEQVRSRNESRLHVQEIGPYVYAQQLERVNVHFNGDRLTFQERNHFHYLPERSVGAHFDQVIVPNLPLLGVVSKALSMDLNAIGMFTLKSALTFANHPNAFLQLPVHRFLWGYEDSIISTAKRLLILKGHAFDKFGLLAMKNGTVSERFTINTGENDKDRMNIIEAVDGEDHLNYWASTECNSLEASDGSIFPPSMLDRKSTLHVFYSNICRRLPYKYEKDVEIQDGIQLLRYRMPLNVFDDPTNNPANQCFCEVDSATCPPRGVTNVTHCTMGAPALISFPHFYLADEKLREDIVGMKPDPLLHDSFLDIHPTLGISLNGKSCLQINVEVREPKMFPALSYLKPGLILPVAWIDMTIDELPSSLRSLVYHGTYSTAAAQLGLTVFSILSLIVSTICLLIMFTRRKQKPCVIVKKVTAETEQKIPTC